MSFLEIAAVVVSALGIWLSTRRSLSSWLVILLASGLYAGVFHEAKLYSDMLLQGVYAAFGVYGWWHWYRGMRSEGTVRVQHISRRGCFGGLLAGAVASLILGSLMMRYTDAALPHVDSTLTSFSLVAQWWTTRKYLENWTLWIVIDTAYTGVFVYKHLYLTSALYAFFVLLAVSGLQAWRKSLTEPPEVETEIVEIEAVTGSNLA
jgi:nicotinamide mononucleotide transporter